jgi:hypothetical protein
MEAPMSDEEQRDPRDFAEALREQEAELSMIRSRSEEAPPRLRAWFMGELSQRRATRRRRIALAAACATTAALALALLIALPGGGEKASVADAAAAGVRPATAPAPRPSRANEYLLDRAIERVPFPNWRERGWRTVGTREDVIDGRRAETVFYQRGGRRLAYTIVSGSPLPPPSDGARSVRARVELTRLAVDGRVVVTWRRRGHTCVLSGAGIPRQELLRLASWKARGRIPY